MLQVETHKFCTDFITAYYPNAKHVILSGSHATNSQTENSDYDILILDRSIDKFKSEKIIYFFKSVDVMRIPLNKVDDTLVLDHSIGHGLFVGMLSKGVVIIDQNDVAKSLITVSKRSYEIGLAAKDVDYLHKLKIQVQGYLDDFDGVTELKMGSYLDIMKLVTKYVDFVLYYHGLWKGNNRMNYKQLEKVEPNFNGKLQKATSIFFTKSNPQPLVDVIKNQMVKYGSQKTLNISGATGNYIDQDYFVMKIIDQNENIYVTMDKLKGQIKKILQLLENPDKFWFFTPNNLIRGESLANQIYLIIFQKQEIINNKIPLISRKLVEASDNLTSFYGPLNMDISLVFNPCFSSDTFKSLIHNICEKLLLQKKATNSTSVLTGLEISHFIASITGRFREFNEYLFDCWLPASYDTGTHLNVNALLVSKKKKKRELKKAYYAQKDFFSRFLSELQNGENYFLNDYLKGMIQDFYKEDNVNNSFHSFHLTGFNNEVSDIEKQAWCKMKTCLDSILGALLIEEVHKSYFPFVLTQLDQLQLKL